MERLILGKAPIAAGVHGVARDMGWRGVPANADRWPHALWHFVAPDGRSALWVSDADAGWDYLLVPSTSAEDWRRRLRATGHLLDRDEVLARSRAARDSQAVQEAVTLLGLLAHGPFDAEIYAFIVASLASRDDRVRSEALSAVTMSSWPEFGAALRAAPLAADAGPEWLREADEIAKAMQAGAWNAGFYSADPPAP